MELEGTAWLRRWLAGALFAGLAVLSAAAQDRALADIWTAAAEGDVAALEQHAAQGADLDATSVAAGVPGSGGTPLHVAVLADQAEVVEWLIAHGVDLEARAADPFGGRPLHWAAAFGRVDIASLLVDAGAGVNLGDNQGFTALDATAAGLSPDAEALDAIRELLRESGGRGREELSAVLPRPELSGRRGKAGPIEAQDWATYNYDARGWRHNAAESKLGPDNVAELVERWRFPAAGSEARIGAIHATPAVVAGYVYFGTATYPAFYCLAPDGALVWVHELSAEREGLALEGVDEADELASRGLKPEAGVYSSALVTRDAVYFADMSGTMYALDRKTGAERWRVDSRAADFPGAHPANIVMASPIAAGGRVIFGGGAFEHPQPLDPAYECCRGRGFVVALELESGRVAWKYDVGPEPEAFDPPIVIRDEYGEHVFRYGPSTSSVWCTPSWDEATNTVFFGTDIHNSPRRATAEDPRNHTEHSAAVIALDATDGSEHWVAQISPGDVWNHSMPPYDAQAGTYKDLSVGDTPKLYTIQVEDEPTEVVGVGCKNGGFYVFRRDSGALIAHTPIFTGPPSRDPEVDPRTLALPGPIGGLQTGCATDGTLVFTNGVDKLPNPDTAKWWEPNPPTGGRVSAISLDTADELWRHERPLIDWIGGSREEPLFRDCGDPIASGIAVAGGVLYCTTFSSNQLLCIEAASGALLKELPLGPVLCGPSVSRGQLYVGTGNTQFTAGDVEAFFPKRVTGELICFGLPDED